MRYLSCSVEGRFDVMSEVAGQDIMEATMTMLDSYCPSIRTDLEGTFKESEAPMKNMEKPLEPVEPVEEKLNEPLAETSTKELPEQPPEVSTKELIGQSVEAPMEECVKDPVESVATEVVVEQTMDQVPENPNEQSTELSNEPSTQEDTLVTIIPDESPEEQS